MHLTIVLTLFCSLFYAVTTKETCSPIEGNVGETLETNGENYTCSKNGKWEKTCDDDDEECPPDQKRGKGCRKPNGKEGTVLIHKCQEYACTSKGKKFFWKKSKLAHWEICCSLNATLPARYCNGHIL